MLVCRGVKEFNVIAQDLNELWQGFIWCKVEIARLIDEIAKVEGVEWIRLHYAYPKDFPWNCLMSCLGMTNVCKYLDIALQHISDNVLENMRRHITGQETRELSLPRFVVEFRNTYPHDVDGRIPGEGEKEFEELVEFVRNSVSERNGIAYCGGRYTYGASLLQIDIPDEAKQNRLSRLMAEQEEISISIQESKIGLALYGGWIVKKMNLCWPYTV